MTESFKKILVIFVIGLVISFPASGQVKDTGAEWLETGELKMTFPSIYFKHNSLDYSEMPYTADSCFRYIAHNYDDDINTLVLWRDSTETEALSDKRIQKLKFGLKKYLEGSKIEIFSMEDLQKISRHTIQQATDKKEIDYLLSLNSVFEVSKTHVNYQAKKSNHIQHPRLTCKSCWRHGFHIKLRIRMRQAEKQSKKNKQQKDS